MITCIQNGKIVTGERVFEADILIQDGRIAKIGTGLTGEKNVDAGGCLVFPGFIDGHTHLDMPVSGTVTADNFKTGTEAALIGGTTMLIDFATQDQGGTLAEALRVWHGRADGNCACDYGFHMAVTDWNEQTRKELHEMAEAGITSFKAYYAYGGLMLDDCAMYDLLCEMHEIGGILGVHCENGPILEHLRAKALEAGCTGPEWHARTRPAVIEGEAVSRFLRIAELADAPAWIVHLSTEDGLGEIRAARARGQRVLVESCPQYLTLTEEVYERTGFEAAKYVCSPPIRPQSDQDALWKALEAGEIDILSTDHCSFNFKGQKEMGRTNFTEIPNGMPGLEHRPTVMYTAAVASGRISVSALCKMMAEIPAKMFGVWGQKGSLEVGKDADIVIYDPQADFTISADNQHHNCDYTPFEGFETKGSVRDVFLRGIHAVHAGELLETGRGQYVARDKMMG